ncbi:hypothetical protein SESBI_04917 [Sesbania bispinosa]|nr:hypothetical protein SESBI_04917 [Sesbania bispinosa]
MGSFQPKITNEPDCKTINEYCPSSKRTSTCDKVGSLHYPSHTHNITRPLTSQFWATSISYIDPFFQCLRPHFQKYFLHIRITAHHPLTLLPPFHTTTGPRELQTHPPHYVSSTPSPPTTLTNSATFALLIYVIHGDLRCITDSKNIITAGNHRPDSSKLNFYGHDIISNPSTSTLNCVIHLITCHCQPNEEEIHKTTLIAKEQ